VNTLSISAIDSDHVVDITWLIVISREVNALGVLSFGSLSLLHFRVGTVKISHLIPLDSSFLYNSW